MVRSEVAVGLEAVARATVAAEEATESTLVAVKVKAELAGRADRMSASHPHTLGGKRP